MDRVSNVLVQLATETQYADLTSEAVHCVKRSVIDSVGCALGAFDAQPVRALRALAARTSAERPATLIGTQIGTSPELAALANGTMIRYADFSDDYFGGRGTTGPHPSDNLGGILAVAESCGVDGQLFVLGAAIAYEVCGRLSDVTSFGSGSGWDYTVLHSIATALASCRIMRLPPDRTAHALALATVANVSLGATRRGQLTDWKGMAGPNGARSGVFAAVLAREGISGPDSPFEGPAGLFHQLAMTIDLSVLAAKRTRFKVEDTHLKALPVRYGAQLPVWIALELSDNVDANEIVSIDVYCPARYAICSKEHPEAWAPMTRATADHSIPFLVAAAIVDGGVTERTFSGERFRDRAVLELTQKVRLIADEAYSAQFPGAMECRINVGLRSGDVISAHSRNPKGHPANPLSDREVEEKFLGQTVARIGRDRAQTLLERLWTLERLDDVGQLFPLMRACA